MPAFLMIKKLLLILIFFFLFSSQVSAEVMINEFLVNPTSPAKEWVEFYNPENVDLTNYFLDDDTLFNDDSGSGKKKELSSLNTTNSNYPYLELNSFLNNSGDYVVLFSSNGDIVDEYQYLSDPGKDISIGRSPDGTDNWVFLDSVSKGASNSCLPFPTPSPILTPIPSLTPTPTPKLMATYKINEAKDEDGEVLSNVKVYIDDVYLHHYAPEVLTFCDDCQCDSYLPCGFGQHTVKLEKAGYEDWNREIDVNPDSFNEVDPMMIFLESNSTPTLTKIPTPTLTPTLTPKKIGLIATFSGEVLGEDNMEEENFYPLEGSQSASQEEEENNQRSSFTFLPKLILSLGVVFLLSGSLWLWYNLKD